MPPGRYVEVAVADSGQGMDAATRARIFEPFFTTKGQGKGTGLGLSMAYGVVTQSGGAIDVTSEPGAGATFRVLLPRREAPAADAPKSLAPPSERGTETILLVEDDAAVRNIGRRVLEGAGYRVVVAANAGEALLHAERVGASVDLVVTDVVMPGMNGRELADRLVPLCPRAAVLYVSGYTDESLERFGVLGRHFLPKPFTGRALTAKVRELLDRDRPAAT